MGLITSSGTHKEEREVMMIRGLINTLTADTNQGFKAYKELVVVVHT